MLVQTVHGNFEGYTREEVERAIMASKMQGRSGHLSNATLKKEVSRNSPSLIFHNSPLHAKDVANTAKIFGPSAACLKGKWTRGWPEVVQPDYIPIP